MKIAHNPDTGEYLGLNNGKWEKLRVAANKEGQKVYLGPDGWTPLDTMGASMPNNAKPTGGSSVIIDDETGAPYQDRFIIGSASSDADKIARARALYGEDAQADADGRIAYTNQETGRRTYVNPSGFDMGDMFGGAREIASAAATLPFNMSAVGIPAGAAAGAATGQGVDALAAYMARNRAEEGGNQPPEMQSLGSVAKDMAWETGLGTIGGNVFKGVGMLGKGLMNPIKESTNAAWTSLGLPSAPSLAFAGKGRGVSSVESALGSTIIGSDPINAATSLGRKTLANKISEVGRNMAGQQPLGTPYEVGSFVYNAAKESKKAFNAAAEQAESKIYGQVGNAPATLKNTTAWMDELLDGLSPEIQEGVRGQITPVIEKAMKDSASGTLNVKSLREVKRQIGKLIDDDAVSGTVTTDKARLRKIYGNIKQDIDDGVVATNPQLSPELETYNKWYSNELTKRQLFDDTFLPQGSATPLENVGKRFFQNDLGPTHLSITKDVLGDAPYDTVRGSIVSRLGAPRSSSGIPEGEISPETLLTQIGNGNGHMTGAMQPETRQMLFGNSLDDVRVAAESMRQAGRAGNTSGTARHMAAIQGLVGGAGATYELSQGDPAEAAKWGGGALILPWLLSKGHTSPAVINYLSRPQGAISRAITDQVLPRIGQIGGGLMAPGGE